MILAFLLFLSAYFIFSPLFFKPNGVVVSFTDSANNCKLQEGDIIEQINGIPIFNVDDFRNCLDSYTDVWTFAILYKWITIIFIVLIALSWRTDNLKR